MAKRGKSSGAGEASVPPALSASKRETVDASVASLSGLNLDQLRLQWRNQLGGIAPAHLPGWLLMRVLAYRIQAAAFGDLDRTILRRLRDDALESGDARPFAPRGPTTREGVGLKSGALLVREVERPAGAGHGPRRRVRLERRRLPQPFAGRQGDHRQARQDRTHCSILACHQPFRRVRPQRPMVRRLSQRSGPIRTRARTCVAWRSSFYWERRSSPPSARRSDAHSNSLLQTGVGGDTRVAGAADRACRGNSLGSDDLTGHGPALAALSPSRFARRCEGRSCARA